MGQYVLNYSGEEIQQRLDEIDNIKENQEKVNIEIDNIKENQEKVNGIISNPNLLDNPWFTVNQREATSWSTDGYHLDRWRTSGAGSFTNGIFKGSATKYQIIEDERISRLLGKTVTISAMLEDYSIVSQTITLPNSLPSNFVSYGSDGKPYMILRSGNLSQWFRTTLEIRAAKLELGTVSTLANDIAPNYTVELLKCQRYYYKFETLVGTSAYVAKRAFITLPVTMRAIPSTSYSVIGGTEPQSITVRKKNLIDVIGKSDDYSHIEVIVSADL